MRHRLLTYFLALIAAAAFVSFGCGGGTSEDSSALGQPYTAFIAGTIGDPTGPGINRDAWASGDADGDAQGDNLYEAVVVSCEFGIPSVGGGALVDVSENDASACATPNNCLIYTKSAIGSSCSIAIDATFSTGLPDIEISWIEIPVQTTLDMKSSMESTDGEVVMGFSSIDWSDAFDFLTDPVAVDLSNCDAPGTGVLELVEDAIWSENDATLSTRYIQGYDFASIDPQTVGPDYYAQCVAYADMVGKVSLADIALGPVTSTGTVHFATLLCDDNWDNDCLLGDVWAY